MAGVIAQITQQALESYLWGTATILRGLVDAGDYKQYVFPLLFYKRLSDVWDEEFAQALADTDDANYARDTANDRFIIPDGAHWKDVRIVAKDVGKALQDAMRAIETANPGRLDGIFGDAPWTNKERLPDSVIKNLLEHFSTVVLSLTNVPEDELGNAYEYLIKQFADDSGHTAQEFYTNRTVVYLMVQMLAPKSGDRIYDPTCGTGGMLISALTEVKRTGGEHRTLKLYGQERNHMTASIARMNLVLHGVGDYQIMRGDTLERPAFTESDRLRVFDVVLANPPYSIKQWNREGFQTDPSLGNVIFWGHPLKEGLTIHFFSTF
jgi:type I restriction enzyme M protein